MELTARIHIENGSYWADVPELRGCFASGGHPWRAIWVSARRSCLLSRWRGRGERSAVCRHGDVDGSTADARL